MVQLEVAAVGRQGVMDRARSCGRARVDRKLPVLLPMPWSKARAEHKHEHEHEQKCGSSLFRTEGLCQLVGTGAGLLHGRPGGSCMRSGASNLRSCLCFHAI